MTSNVLKRCYKCEQTKPISDFARRSGPNSQFRNVCRECTNAAVSARRYRTLPAAREKSREKMRRWRSKPENRLRANRLQLERSRLSPRNALRLMIFNARKRAEVSITPDDLYALWERQGGFCAITGVTMTWGRGRIEPTSMSIDRLDSGHGYSIDNVRLICHCVNCFRGRMSDDEMFNMALAIVTNMRRPKLRLVS